MVVLGIGGMGDIVGLWVVVRRSQQIHGQL
jgi:hypothetical protein